VALGDVNGDGRLDIVTADQLNTTVSVLLGNGNGTFKAQANFSTGGTTYPRSVSLGDVNGDGKLDIVNSASTKISVLLGNGNGTFIAQTQFSAGAGTYSSNAFLGDVNGAGKLDIVTANSQGSVSLLLGNGTFQAPATFATANVPAL